MNRTAAHGLHQRRRRIEGRAKSTEAVEFFNVLTSPQLLQTTEALLPEHRERLYPPTVRFSATVRSEKRRRPSGTSASPSSLRMSAGRLVMSRPSTDNVPVLIRT